MAVVEGYRHPELLAEPDWVLEHREDSDVRLIDCRKIEAYREAHLPGAVLLPMLEDPGTASPLWLKSPTDANHVVGPDDFAKLMGRAGVSNDTTVVCYSDAAMFATRLWWVLNYYGHTKAKVLNGGWRRWISEGRPVTTAESNPPHAKFAPRTHPERICLVDDLMARYTSPKVHVLNVLPEGMYAGRDNRFDNKHPGHIPGSINIDSDHFLDETGAFKSASQLSEILSAAGVTQDREVIVHCQGGIRTTIGVFVLSLLGRERVRAYDGSMGEWSNRDDTPVTMKTTHVQSRGDR